MVFKVFNAATGKLRVKVGPVSRQTQIDIVTSSHTNTRKWS